MTYLSSKAAFKEFRAIFHVGATGNLTDGQLLERFLTAEGQSAELAFAAIVERHGPLVHGVCHAILREDHDAEDAFQATFLVLLRKARTLWVQDSLGPWLHGVAHRTALSSKVSRRRRQLTERLKPELDPALIAVEPDLPDDNAAILHAEIERLPDRYRDSIILCDLQGLTLNEAADRLGCPVGTIKSRLSRARLKLRENLLRRGLALEGIIGHIVAAESVRTSPPSVLVRSTVDLAIRMTSMASGKVVIPPTIAEIAQGVSSGMFDTKFAQLLVPLLTLSIATGVGLDTSGNNRDRAKPPTIGDEIERGAQHQGKGLLLLEVGLTTSPETINARGAVEATQFVEIRSPVQRSMKILALLPEGTEVNRDQFVCELDTGELRRELAEQQILRERASAGYQNATKYREIAEINLKEYMESVHPNTVKTIEREVKLAELNLARARERQGWSDKMFELGYVSKEQTNTDEQKLEQAKWDLVQAKLKLRVLK